MIGGEIVLAVSIGEDTKIQSVGAPSTTPQASGQAQCGDFIIRRRHREVAVRHAV